MRVLLMLCGVVLVLAGAPAAAPAADCGDELSACLSRTVLFGTPEEWDIVGCQVDYTLCLARELRFA